MAFPDFPFDKELPSFIGHMDVRKYLDAYADHFDLKRFIQVRIFLTITSHFIENCSQKTPEFLGWYYY